MVPSVVVHRGVAGVPASVTASMLSHQRREGKKNEHILSICFFLIGAYAALWCVF